MKKPKLFTPEKLQHYWATGKILIYKGKKYTVNKMSYGDYFFQPANWKGGEKDGHSPNTLWLEKILIKNQHHVNQLMYKVDD